MQHGFSRFPPICKAALTLVQGLIMHHWLHTCVHDLPSPALAQHTHPGRAVLPTPPAPPLPPPARVCSRGRSRCSASHPRPSPPLLRPCIRNIKMPRRC